MVSKNTLTTQKRAQIIVCLVCRVVEADEPGYGDVWTFTAICADTKLVPFWLVGEALSTTRRSSLKIWRGGWRAASSYRRTATRCGEGTVGPTFEGRVDRAAIQKTYVSDPNQRGQYRPPVCTGTKRGVLEGHLDPDRISTSYVERQNLTMRMGMRRAPRRWRLGWPITSGRWKRSRRCWTETGDGWFAIDYGS